METLRALRPLIIIAIILVLVVPFFVSAKGKQTWKQAFSL